MDKVHKCQRKKCGLALPKWRSRYCSDQCKKLDYRSETLENEDLRGRKVGNTMENING